MRLLSFHADGDFSQTSFASNNIPSYAILSHTWEADDQEVTFDDLKTGKGKDKNGYRKIEFCGYQAKRDSLQYFWVDSCCIDKSTYTEVVTAINSMFRWYQNAARCYVFLSDVPSRPLDTNEKFNQQSADSDFRRSRWFTRGWTLQELLAPASVEFFSRDGERLGNKSSLKKIINEITGIPELALQGAPLSQFTVDERLSWINARKTKVEEDMIYSLLGIFDVTLPKFYNEGVSSAYKRLREAINEREKCIQDLRITDPRDDKKRIEDLKGGLVADSYHWILDNSDFKQWRNDRQGQLLWIKGDPGKGKTMLLCGIINELKKCLSKSDLLSYFFCQATDSRINNATAVLRGLLYLLIEHQPSLTSHVQERYNHAGKNLFEDTNAWIAVSNIFSKVLKDPSLKGSYLVIDALDECTVDLPDLLRFIQEQSSSHVKWLVSSRNWPPIEQRLDKARNKVKLCLELNAESVSGAVNSYIQQRVHQLAQEKMYDDDTRDAVLHHMSANAKDTFLWVALVYQNLLNVDPWRAIDQLNKFPPGLDPLYERMIEQIESLDEADRYKQILASVAILYEPVSLKELSSLARISQDRKWSMDIIGYCGSFLTLREDIVHFVHHSAKEFLLSKAFVQTLPSGWMASMHHSIFSESLRIMSNSLRRDMCNLIDPGFPIEKVKQVGLDTLDGIQYSCTYWVDHLVESFLIEQQGNGLDLVCKFLMQSYLYWLEALSLLRQIPRGVRAIEKLKDNDKGVYTSTLRDLVWDALRFVQYHKQVIENYPLQVYIAGLIFTPCRSPVRKLFMKEHPRWIETRFRLPSNWNICAQTLEGHKHWINSVTASRSGTQLASASTDKTIKIWDTVTGECCRTLVGHDDDITSVAFFSDNACLASASRDCTVKIWYPRDNACVRTFRGHTNSVNSVTISFDDMKLASCSDDKAIKIWDVAKGNCLRTLLGHSGLVLSVTFSSDGARLASASSDKTIKIWNVMTSACLQTLEGHGDWVTSVTFLLDNMEIASGSFDHTVKIWSATTGDCLRTLIGHSNEINSVALSSDGTKLASAGKDKVIKIWDTAGRQCPIDLPEQHRLEISSLVFWQGGSQLASASSDMTIRIWDIPNNRQFPMSEDHHHDWISALTFSSDATRLASASSDKTIKIWDIVRGTCVKTLHGLTAAPTTLIFSQDGTQLVSFSVSQKDIRTWDITSGQLIRTGEIITPIIDGTQVTQRQRLSPYVLKVEDEWITCNSRKLLWLPPEYRPSVFTATELTVAIGCASGRVLLFCIQDTHFPSQDHPIHGQVSLI